MKKKKRGPLASIELTKMEKKKLRRFESKRKKMEQNIFQKDQRKDKIDGK